jgi:hypothetical protein
MVLVHAALVKMKLHQLLLIEIGVVATARNARKEMLFKLRNEILVPESVGSWDASIRMEATSNMP